MAKAKAASAKKSQSTKKAEAAKKAKAVAIRRPPLKIFKIGQSRETTLMDDYDGPPLHPPYDAVVYSVLRDANDIPTGRFVLWRDAKARSPGGSRKLFIHGTPELVERASSEDGGTLIDLIGDLNVTVQYPSDPSQSVSISTVLYEQP